MSDEDHGQGRDAAAEAFEELRAEVTLLRRAVERLTAERTEMPEPKDYDDTLGRIVKAITGLAERMDVLADRAALKLTPESVARQVASAADAVRREEQQRGAEARGALEKATARLDGIVLSARRGDQQNRWLAGSAIGGAVLGMVLWMAFAGVVARAVPESWLWPERMAARTLRLDSWSAGRRLAAVSQPEMWNRMVAGAIVVQENRAAIDGCRKTANRAGEPVRCTVRITPDRVR